MEGLIVLLAFVNLGVAITTLVVILNGTKPTDPPTPKVRPLKPHAKGVKIKPRWNDERKELEAELKELRSRTPSGY